MGLFQWLLQELRALRKLVEVLRKHIAQLQQEMHDMQHSNREEKVEAAANAQQTLEEHQASARAFTKQLEAGIAQAKAAGMGWGGGGVHSPWAIRLRKNALKDLCNGSFGETDDVCKKCCSM